MTDSLVRQEQSTASMTVAAADVRSHDLWEHVQRGLVYPAPHALFATGGPVLPAPVAGIRLGVVARPRHDMAG
ncbi:hypothetical protein [Labedaea rhizosphaerae]|uniref:Uncharacterized protein n=1 Tax=Labedaea rhizosphaerae TaxID=598644 RepID=A0A4R6SE33_LABRH|nr:hypothetical protein [Labedaea rhizosphaerae]TDP97957.1 hypothetical protein EV186_103937 [Labedaea rhizosphaerae]